MQNLIEKVAKQMTEINKSDFKEFCPISIVDINKWEWAQGVGIYGLYRYYEASGNEEYLNYLVNWFNRRIEEGLPEKNVNTCAPMLTLALVYEKTGNERYLELIKEWSAWIMNDMPKTMDNGFQHVVSGGLNNYQLWDDTLFMCVLFLAKAGIILNRKDYIEETKLQFLIHIKYLYDKNSGLWYHGWNFIGNTNYAKALWCRGNCWFTAGVVDYIEMIGFEKGDAIKTYLTDTLKAQVRALEALQDKSGLWHTLIDDQNSYLEASGSAGFCYGILKGIRMGILDEKYLDCGKRALKGIIDCVDENGTVTNVSYGTGISADLDFYRNIELCPMTYGQALAILCMSESMNHTDLNL